MELHEVIRRRRMVRAYDPDRPVDPEVLHRVLEHAVRAPSAGFSQGVDLLVLRTAEERGLFWTATTDPEREPDRWLRGVSAAPVLVLCLSHPDAYLDRYAESDKGWTDRDPQRWPVPYWDVDTGMSAMLMLLTATDEGLGALFFGVQPEHHAHVRASLRIPEDRRIVGVVALGHPAAGGAKGSASRRARRPLEEVAHDGRFGARWNAEAAGGQAC